MANFIKEYFNQLHHSDEKTKHRSALTMAVIASVIILSIIFLFIKDSFLSISKKSNSVNNQTTMSKDNIESPIQAFSSFFSEAGKQFSKAKDLFKDVSNLKNKDSLQNSTNNQ